MVAEGDGVGGFEREVEERRRYDLVHFAAERVLAVVGDGMIDQHGSGECACRGKL